MRRNRLWLAADANRDVYIHLEQPDSRGNDADQYWVSYGDALWIPQIELYRFNLNLKPGQCREFKLVPVGDIIDGKEAG